MTYGYEEKEMGAYFGLSTDYTSDHQELTRHQGVISILWNKSNIDFPIVVDGIATILPANHLTTVTYLNQVDFGGHPDVIGFGFNRAFYCIRDHDHEVSCNGILFFGSQKTPIIRLDEVESNKFDLLYQVFLDEFQTRDNIQGEMLRMLLKRLIIKTTRLSKSQFLNNELDESQINLIRNSMYW